METGKLYINGEWTKGEKYYPVINPSTEKTFGEAVLGNEREVDLAVEAARNALYGWRALAIEERERRLRTVASFLGEAYGKQGKVTKLKQLIRDEMGKRIPETDIEVIESCQILNYFATHGSDFLRERKINLNKDLWPTKESRVIFEPVGVVAIIKAWNYPLEIPIWSLAPALVAGNTVVFKPSEYSPFVAIELMKIFERAGLEKGVLNLVTGDKKTGEMLVDHPSVDIVSFTGSNIAGTKIATKCAARHLRCNLELSGNDAAIVEEDADIELAANGLVWGAFCNAGQVCVGVKRAYVNTNIYHEFIELVTKKTKKLEKGSDFGPLINKGQLDKVLFFVNDAVAKGARVLAGGRSSENGKGYFFEPTVLIGINDTMELMKEECFGPILPIVEVKDTDEAISMANKSLYGLGASIWTSDLEKAEQMAERIEAGTIWINDVNVAYPEVPWTATKQSGPGVDLSEFSLYEYVNIKHVSKERSSNTKRPWWFPYKRYIEEL